MENAHNGAGGATDGPVFTGGAGMDVLALPAVEGYNNLITYPPQQHPANTVVALDSTTMPQDSTPRPRTKMLWSLNRNLTNCTMLPNKQANKMRMS